MYLDDILFRCSQDIPYWTCHIFLKTIMYIVYLVFKYLFIKLWHVSSSCTYIPYITCKISYKQYQSCKYHIMYHVINKYHMSYIMHIISHVIYRVIMCHVSSKGIVCYAIVHASSVTHNHISASIRAHNQILIH